MLVEKDEQLLPTPASGCGGMAGPGSLGLFGAGGAGCLRSAGAEQLPKEREEALFFF